MSAIYNKPKNKSFCARAIKKNLTNLSYVLLYITTSLHKKLYMHRLNLTIDENLLKRAKVASFLTKKSISQMVRESLSDYLTNNKKVADKTSLVLNADDEQELSRILSDDEFITDKKFSHKFDL
ncbi:MAG: hypothetical protein DRQ51_07655 [Gammaproteobacteria bacterium]|nr:MAG: hypothetical protein DRQ51_07655 [Gammaproteobacteria bacterium]